MPENTVPPQKPTSSPQGKKLLEQVSDALRVRHYSYRTEQTYIEWIRRYILFHKKRHPNQMGEAEIKAFVSYLASERKVAASTQNQALSSILFLYRVVLQKEINLPPDLIRPSKPKRLPTVLSHTEAMSVINQMRGAPRLMTMILYGSGLRLNECLRLRVKDIDFENRQIIVRGGKGDDDRFTILPDSVAAEIKHRLMDVKAIHEKDLREGYGEAALPFALAKKYPNAGKDWVWQYIFPASQRSVDPQTGITRRHHLDETVLQKAIRQAALQLKIDKPVSPHAFRHSFATTPTRPPPNSIPKTFVASGLFIRIWGRWRSRRGYDIRTVQELLGHKDVKTTMIYTHVLQRGGLAVRSPLDT